MGNIALSHVNRARASTPSAGSWSSGLPITNIITRDLGTVARSTDATTASTKFRLDFGASRALRAFALVNHNLSSSATWLIKIGTTSGASDVYSGSAVNAWQLASFDATVVALGIDDSTYQRSDYASIIVLPATYSGRYVTIEIVDTGNADGYVQIGMVWAGALWVPAVNAKFGLQNGHGDLSSISYAMSGADYSSARRRPRTVKFLLPHLTVSETEIVHELERVIGTIDDLLYVPDIEDAAATQRYGFVGRMSTMSALEYVQYAVNSKGFSIIERVP